MAAFLEECEQAAPVADVDLVECNERETGLAADVELSLGQPSPDGDAMSLCATSLNTDGTLRLGFETAEAVLPVADHDVEVEPQGATLTTGGTVRVELSAFVPAGDASPDAGSAATAVSPDVEPSTSAATARDATLAGTERDREVPPFKDPDLLAEVYESCETFAEMAEILEMDVTAETVRRYMIDYDIHEPNSYDTTDEADDASTAGEEEQVVLSDGIGLPEDITVEELIETVKGSNTIYEVKRDVGVGRQDALEMLRELNLLDMVVGRLATEAERDISRDDVVERLREASATRTGR
ncbi:MAG: hypothetical protein BRD23_05855 [Halobacteriales archaeon SW_9_67_25]|nr:MAG: hypothetical protein BRD23_05855 [Halobacteriales archaeon SW_9_67_25]